VLSPKQQILTRLHPGLAHTGEVRCRMAARVKIEARPGTAPAVIGKKTINLPDNGVQGSRGTSKVDSET
jgi:hypothetical protein